MKKLVLLGCAMLTTCIDLGSTEAAEPGWSPVIIASGAYRQQLESTPIVNRPYRPFHFYGNTVRRRHYRGTALPSPRELIAVGLFPVARANR